MSYTILTYNPTISCWQFAGSNTDHLSYLLALHEKELGASIGYNHGYKKESLPHPISFLAIPLSMLETMSIRYYHFKGDHSIAVITH